jgi:transposase InsO family protein
MEHKRFKVLSNHPPTRYYNITQISSWRLEDIAPMILELWKNSETPTPETIDKPEWQNKERRIVLENLFPMENSEDGSIWIGVPTEVKMGWEVRQEILPYYWEPKSKREYVESYLQSSPKTIKIGVYTAWKAITEYCVGIKLVEVREIMRGLSPNQLMKPVSATHRPVMALIAKGPHCWFQLDTIFLNTITSTPNVLLMIDIFTKYLWTFPMSSTKSETSWEKAGNTIKNELAIFHRIYPKGEPQDFKIHTDNGSEFKKDFDEGVKGLGEDVTHVFGAPYHPWSQGVVERVGKTLKSLIALYRVQRFSMNWKGSLEELTGNYNDTVHSSTNLKPSYFHSITSIPWTEETKQLVERVKEKMMKKAGKNQWGDGEIVGRVGDLARIMLDDEKATPSKEKNKTIFTHVSNWSKALYEIVSVGRSSVTKGPIYTLRRRLEDGSLDKGTK